MSRESLKIMLQSICSGEPPDVDLIHHIDVGNKKFLGFIEEEVLQNLVLQGAATCRFFEGPYGAGKSHILQMLYRLGIQNNMLVAHIELSKAASLKNWDTLTSYILASIELNRGGKSVKGLPKILEELGRYDQIDTSDLKQKSFSHSGFVNAMIKASNSDGFGDHQKALLHGYLLGEKVGAGKMRSVGIHGVKNPLTKRNAESVLNTILSALYTLGLPTILLVDETEISLGSPYAESSQKAANLIRRLVDACNTGTIVGTLIVFAVLPGFIANCAKTYQAVGERLLPPKIGGGNTGWRWPVLALEDISTAGDQASFLEECVLKFEQIINLGGGDTNNIRYKLGKAGRDVIESNAGISFRRDLLKRFASMALERIS